MPPNKENLAAFQEVILSWFEREGRDFPWRNTSDPFQILLAEKLLQQSAARPGLVNAYLEVLQCYPTPFDLSKANIIKLEAIIRPLGFIYRAKELVRMAEELVDRYSGLVPRDFKSLMLLTGVGDYAARAVLSFAYGDDVPIVDTNVARFLYRLYGLQGPLPANPARKKSLIELAASLVPKGQSRNYNLAVLDLCAKICKLKVPLCSQCPVYQYCEYGLHSAHLSGPRKEQTAHND